MFPGGKVTWQRGSVVWERGFKDLWPQTERAAVPKGRRRRGSKDCRNGPWSLHCLHRGKLKPTLSSSFSTQKHPNQEGCSVFLPQHRSSPNAAPVYPPIRSSPPSHCTPWGTAAAAKETRGAAASPKGEGKGQSWQQEVPAGAAHGAGAAAAPEGTEHPGEGSRAKTPKWVFPTGAPTKPPEVKSIRAACAPSQCCTLGTGVSPLLSPPGQDGHGLGPDTALPGAGNPPSTPAPRAVRAAPTPPGTASNKRRQQRKARRGHSHCLLPASSTAAPSHPA